MREAVFDTVVRARAPLQVGLCGLHATIARFAQATLRALPERTVRIRSLELEDATDYAPGASPPLDERFGNVAACLRRVRAEAAALEHGLEIDLATDAPPGCGLGAPSALAVAIIGAFAAWQGLDLAPHAIAELAREVGPGPGGALDAYASTFGGFALVERRGERGAAMRPLPVDPDVVHELQRRSLLVFSDTRRTPVGPPFPEVLGGTLATEAGTALLEGRLDVLACLLHEEWVSGPDVADTGELYAAARAAGALGGTRCGTGAGGCVLLLCPPERRPAVRRRLRDLGARVSAVEFTSAGLRSWLQDAEEAP
ncbi:MAG: hypothetical protein LBJ87_01345 [bacterium]|jgi:D-glycero-alpha-D-manno-heptose-7-phosphate kinase|nr:hypothetical protein [bacterium]